MRWLVCLMLCVLMTPTAWAQLVTVPIPGSPLSLSVMANPQPLQELKNNPAATLHQLGDDGWVNVPLPFNFPFYGQSFNQSTMYSNGAVQFGNPVPAGGWPNWNNAFCCQGIQLNSGVPAGYNYSILALQTDLAGWEGVNHYTLGTANSMTYGWYGVSQYGNNNNRSTFELKIDSGGGIDMRWSGARITYAPVSIGTIGNAAAGEFTQNYYSPNGIDITALTQLSTGIAVDPCVTNPLSSPACPGYAAAYLGQQCTISALYDPTCPGYTQAYFDQQCSLNGLYDRKCPNYATAWATQQLLSQQNTSSVDTQTNSTTETPTATTTAATTTVTATTPAEITSAAPSANPANVTTAVPLTPTAPAVSSPVAPASITATVAAPASERAPASTQSQAPAQPQTRAQQLQQARQEAARKSVAAQGTAAQAEAREAKSMEQQAAAQASVITAMGYNAAFSTYENTLLRDVQFYRPREIYGNQTTVDNQRLLRGLTGSSDLRWETMRDKQYP